MGLRVQVLGLRSFWALRVLGFRAFRGLGFLGFCLLAGLGFGVEEDQSCGVQGLCGISGSGSLPFMRDWN